MFTTITHNKVKTIALLAIMVGGLTINSVQADEVNLTTTSTENTTVQTTGDQTQDGLPADNTNGSGSGDGGTCPLGIPLLCGWW